MALLGLFSKLQFLRRESEIFCADSYVNRPIFWIFLSKLVAYLDDLCREGGGIITSWEYKLWNLKKKSCNNFYCKKEIKTPKDGNDNNFLWPWWPEGWGPGWGPFTPSRSPPPLFLPSFPLLPSSFLSPPMLQPFPSISHNTSWQISFF